MNNLDFEDAEKHIKSVEGLAQRIDSMRQTLAYDLQLGNESSAKFSAEEYERLVVEYQEEVGVLIDCFEEVGVLIDCFEDVMETANDLNENVKAEEAIIKKLKGKKEVKKP
jgi:hypothetical protein